MSQPSSSPSPAVPSQQAPSHPPVAAPSVPQIAFLGQSVIPLVNKLQDIFAQLGTGAASIDLPQVAVVGSQSSGKSSVLEALVGRDFLPRGQDICTRRPLVLQLVQTVRREHGERAGDVAEWGEFLHLPGRRFTDFSAIRKEIQAETDRETGMNRGVSEKQIRLKIFSPNVLNITLVDLPGITKVPTGDQPTDIEARIRTMVLSYIKHSTCLILAVSPANADLANSDALQIARIADPDGSRTIGVISKLDIMDRGTDARNILLGSVVPLKLGYIGVVNRSQEDINTNKSIRDAIAYEEQFFRSRPVYHSLADRCGIQQLAVKLNTILVKHIQSILPDLRARINAQVVTLQKELVSYGEVTESKSGQGALLLNILTRYSKSFGETVDGKNENMSTHELSGGARIHYIFQAIFVKSLEDVDPCDDLSDEDIRTAIQNATGPRSVLFVPEVPFEMLVRRQIARLLEPSLQCARFVYEELVKISHRCETLELQRFPVLRRRVDDVVSHFLREGLIPAETMIGHLIEMEMDYINTSHPSFVGGSKAVEMALQDRRSSKEASEWKDSGADRLLAVPDKGPKARGILSRSKTPPPDFSRRSSEGNHGSERPSTSGSNGLSAGGWGITSIFHTERSRGEITSTRVFSETMIGSEPLVSVRLKEPPLVLRAADAATEQETIEIAVTRVLLKSYYDIVRKNIQDQVPKAIMHFLVNHVKRELHSVFIRKLYRENLFDEVLQEREEIAQKRRRCKEILKVLQQASYTLEDLPLEDGVTSSFSGVTLSGPDMTPSSIFSSNLALSNLSTPRLMSSKSMFKRPEDTLSNGSTSPISNGPSLGPGLGGIGGRG